MQKIKSLSHSRKWVNKCLHLKCEIKVKSFHEENMQSELSWPDTNPDEPQQTYYCQKLKREFLSHLKPCVPR